MANYDGVTERKIDWNRGYDRGKADFLAYANGAVITDWHMNETQEWRDGHWQGWRHTAGWRRFQ